MTGTEAERPKPTETEATLVVVSGTPEETLDAVAALAELDGHALLDRPDQAIRDRYFDTADGALAARGDSLRIREVGPETLLTLKGPARAGLGGARIREEQEQAWPGAAWALLREELGADLALAHDPPALDPVDALRAVGLVLVQDRENWRRVRAVVPRGGGEPVAELAIDGVTFHLEPGPVRHSEIEVESKADGGDAAVATLAEGLVLRFWPALRPWSIGKLSTGKAAATLIGRDGRDSVLTAAGALRPEAYDAIAALFPAEPVAR